jgi:hypothetical protein
MRSAEIILYDVIALGVESLLNRKIEVVIGGFGITINQGDGGATETHETIMAKIGDNGVTEQYLSQDVINKLNWSI